MHKIYSISNTKWGNSLGANQIKATFNLVQNNKPIDWPTLYRCLAIVFANWLIFCCLKSNEINRISSSHRSTQVETHFHHFSLAWSWWITKFAKIPPNQIATKFNWFARIGGKHWGFLFNNKSSKNRLV